MVLANQITVSTKPAGQNTVHSAHLNPDAVCCPLYKTASLRLTHHPSSTLRSHLDFSSSTQTHTLAAQFVFETGSSAAAKKSQRRAMESVEENGGSRLVVTELGYIKELVRQLDVNLGGCPDHCKRLAAQIFAVTERSIGMIRSGKFDCRKRSAAGLDSLPFSATPSPLSDVSGMPFHTNNKKRKIMEKRKHQVRVSSEGGGAETPVDDGHSWRKYGQKDILGAKHPRGYYRCTHRKSQGCAATKQVQRADEDPALFDVIYHGEHTCVHKTAAGHAAAAMVQTAAGHAAAAMVQPAEENPDARRLLQNLSTSLTVNSEGLTATAGHQGCGTTTSFCFSSQAASALTPQEHYPFFMPSTPENCFGQGASLSTSLEPSPVTSDSNHFSMTPFQAEWRAQSELDEVVSALVAAGTMPAEETAVSLDGFEFDVSCFFALDD